jgi:hypothetical protein
MYDNRIACFSGFYVPVCSEPSYREYIYSTIYVYSSMRYKKEQMIHFRFPVSGTTGSSGMRRGTTTESSTDGRCHCAPHKINNRKQMSSLKSWRIFLPFCQTKCLPHTRLCNFCCLRSKT